MYRGELSFRRVCALVAHLPADAAVWRAASPRGAWTRTELLLAATERRVTALWATIAVTLGQQVSDAQLAGPLDTLTGPDTAAAHGDTVGGREPETASLREIAVWMRGG